MGSRCVLKGSSDDPGVDWIGVPREASVRSRGMGWAMTEETRKCVYIHTYVCVSVCVIECT